MTPIPGPIILLGLPLLVAGVAYLVRRWAILAAFLSSATTGALALLCLRLPLGRSAFVLGQEVAFGRPVVILGRELALDPAGQMWLAFAFALSTIFYLYAWRMSQGRSFFSFSLVILSLYALTVLLQTFSLAVLIFAISAALTVFIIQGGLRPSVRGAQRYLLITLLAVPLLLAAAWFVDPTLSEPDSAGGLVGGTVGLGGEPGLIRGLLARQSLLPAALGFGLLLAAFPFGAWLPALAADAPPIVAAFVFTVGQAMALYLALVFVRDAPFTLDDPAILAAIQLAGLVMAAGGGVMAAAQRDFGRLFGYAALSSQGLLLLALGMGGSQGLTLALLHTAHRAIAMTLLAAALSILRHRATTDQFAGLRGMARRLPIATMGLALGVLALAGFPFTAGFPTHWAISRAVWNWTASFGSTALVASSTLAQGASLATETVAPGRRWVEGLALLALLASSVGVVIGLLRGLSAMRGDLPGDDESRLASAPPRQPVIASLMVLALAVLSTVVGLYPQLFLAPVQRAAQAFSLF